MKSLYMAYHMERINGKTISRRQGKATTSLKRAINMAKKADNSYVEDYNSRKPVWYKINGKVMSEAA